MAEQRSKTVLVSGYAQAPRGTGMSEMMTWVGVVLEIDVTTHRILRADGTFLTELARTYFRETVLDYRLTDGFDGLAARLAERFQTPTKPALIVACQAAYQRYVEFRQSRAP
jgi:hypothetical protein